MRPSIEQAVDLLVQREEVRLHSENSVTIALSGLRRLDGDTFTGRGPRIRLSLEQPWHARLLIGELVFTIDIAIAGCTVGEICSTVTATATGVVEAPVRRAPRMAVRVPATVRTVAAAVEQRGQLPGSLVNLSAGGVELVTEAELVPGDVVDVDARVLEHRLEARCQVVHARIDRHAGTVSAGLRFLQQQPAVLGLLHSIADNPVIEPLDPAGSTGERRRFGLRRRRAA